MAHAAILVDEEFQDAEVIYPFYRLQEAGHDVHLVGPEEKTYTGNYGYTFQADRAARNTDIQDYAVLIIPGGNAPDKMRTKDAMVQLVRDADTQNKVIAAICHGAQMLIEADIVDGKTATCYQAVSKDMENAGANYIDKPFVVEGKLVTSRKPADLPDFMRETLRLL